MEKQCTTEALLVNRRRSPGRSAAPPISGSSGPPDWWLDTCASVPTGPEKPDAVLTTQPGPTGGEAVLAVFDIHDNFTGGLLPTGAQLDTIEILKYTTRLIRTPRNGDDPRRVPD